MITAYVLVKANSPEADRLRDATAAVDGVEDAHIVAGDVDLIAKLRVDSTAAVKRVATEGIGSINGVESTQTHVAMD